MTERVINCTEDVLTKNFVKKRYLKSNHISPDVILFDRVSKSLRSPGLIIHLA